MVFFRCWELFPEAGGQMAERKGTTKVKHIVVTGGPCAGKSSCMAGLRAAVEAHGWHMLLIPEVATELIREGVSPFTCASGVAFQVTQFAIERVKEDCYQRVAPGMGHEKVLIVSDRSLLDGRAYVTPDEFDAILAEQDMDLAGIVSRYDGVFHLETTAKGAREAYTLANNKTRSESPEEAVALDDRLIAAWSCHPYQVVIESGTDFDEKVAKLNAAVLELIEG
jgi:predicted ATPase